MTTNPSDDTQAGATPPPAGATPPPAGAYPPPQGAYPPPQQGYVPAAQPPLAEHEQRQWAMFSHLGGILFGFLAPLVIWLVYKERGHFVSSQAKEALNFQILHTIAQIALYIVVSIIAVVTLGIGSLLFVLNFAAYVGMIVFSIIGGMAANKGQEYRYPVNWRIIK